MLIGEDESGYTVAFEARSIDDVLALDDGRDEPRSPDCRSGRP
jgi:hypothetical protein